MENAEKCGDCKFNQWGTCYGMPPRNKWLAHAHEFLSVRPRVEDGERACSLFEKREERR